VASRVNLLTQQACGRKTRIRIRIEKTIDPSSQSRCVPAEALVEALDEANQNGPEDGTVGPSVSRRLLRLRSILKRSGSAARAWPRSARCSAPSGTAARRKARTPSSGRQLWPWPAQRVCRHFSDGPGRSRTCDLGIKSPAGIAAATSEQRKLAATRPDRGCNELNQTAGPGDEPVLPGALPLAVLLDNGRLGLLLPQVEERRVDRGHSSRQTSCTDAGPPSGTRFSRSFAIDPAGRTHVLVCEVVGSSIGCRRVWRRPRSSGRRSPRPARG